MRLLFSCLGGGLIGIITASIGWGWFLNGHFSLKGMAVNLLGVIFWVGLMHLFFKD